MANTLSLNSDDTVWCTTFYTGTATGRCYQLASSNKGVLVTKTFTDKELFDMLSDDDGFYNCRFWTDDDGSRPYFDNRESNTVKIDAFENLGDITEVVKTEEGVVLKGTLNSKGVEFARQTGCTSLEKKTEKPKKPEYAMGYIFDKREDALAVLYNLSAALNLNGKTSVSYFYELIEKETKPLDTKRGWTSLANASIEEVARGWLLDLPETVEL